jgi:hypothetical protein
VKADGGEQHAPPRQAVIPVAIDKHGTAGRPHRSLRHPEPIVVTHRPIARTPLVIIVVVNPVPGHPKMVVSWLRADRSAFEAFGRVGLISQFLLGLRHPESGHPLIPACDFRPITGQPALSHRSTPPQTADPEEFFLIVIPGPIAGNPFDVVSVRHRVRRNLVDRFRRLLNDDESGSGIGVVHFREGFMQRPSHHHRQVFVGHAVQVSRNGTEHLLRGKISAGAKAQCRR